MKLTKYGHACWRVEKDGKVLVIDPGVFTPEPEALAGADAVLITHAHFDHVDVDRLSGLDIPIWTCAGVIDEGVKGQAVRHGDTFEAAGFGVRVFGEWHAANHPDQPVIDNVGFLVDDELFYPGDALTVPDASVGTLLVPTGAPWMKLAEMVEYLRTVRPARAYSTHDALYSEAGLGLVDRWLQLEADKQGADMRRIKPGESVTLS
ncbi:MBL fold metallo-hydrolase [Nonomuraea soli]|uniref:L-ascorbate metabolism protein UlaG (Beta-lactamase superfamily) n=1 Tax=Nonomuraea soli TaxID=1032476 RepID=A0A7W0CMW9_9ACTN|nr:MBL fold metallo-hydrolase [Nonomuraea soli]MBA2894111.1 L-ascorbate metabolism protein UlaG (beta-lactamase superfamily) [Nonomuraea soli]